MARRTMVQRLLGDELLELRLMRLPLDARYAWEHLVEIIARRGENGMLRLGFELGCELGFAGWFAHWFRIPETQMQTHLETLALAGLLIVTGEALALPGLSGAAARRAETARANGSKGGRPRNKPPSDQVAMPLPFAPLTAVEKPTETQIETQTARDDADAQLSSASSSSNLEESLKAELAEPPPATSPVGLPEATDAAALADELLALLGGAVAASNREADRPERVQGWLDRGVTPAGMRQIVREAVARPRKPGDGPIATLKWFEPKMQAAASGPRLVEAAAATAAQSAAPAVPQDPRVAHLPASDRGYANKLLANLRRLEEAGGVPAESPSTGDATYHAASFARRYCRPAFDAVVPHYPQIAGWFGEEPPAVQRAELSA